MPKHPVVKTALAYMPVYKSVHRIFMWQSYARNTKPSDWISNGSFVTQPNEYTQTNQKQIQINCCLSETDIVFFHRILQFTVFYMMDKYT